MSKTSISAISNLMVGEDYKESFLAKTPSHSSNNSFILKSYAITIQNSNISDSKNTFFNQSLNFELHPFEIIAFVGVENNGQEDIFNILVGLEKPLGGKFYFKNTNTNLLLMNTKKRNDSGISFIAGDRHKYSIALDFSLWENMILSNYYIKPNSYYSCINFNYIKSQTQKVVDKYDVRGVDSSNNIIRGLSGGNQQKFVLGREIEKNNSLICVMQPTRGLDILATQNIHKLLIEERNKGKGILLISYDLDEVFALADKVIVFYKNQFTSPINISEIDRRQIGVLMLGGELNHDSI
ncbi:MAG: ATP-binding cassette domain-containing protein [Mycoplasma sp.]|nr:ATP-binding cassette domain-containing protein [Mycoplasma sp.]